MDELSIILGSGGIIASRLVDSLTKNEILIVLEFGVKEGTNFKFYIC
jgi:hypothetical protein